MMREMSRGYVRARAVSRIAECVRAGGYETGVCYAAIKLCTDVLGCGNLLACLLIVRK